MNALLLIALAAGLPWLLRKVVEPSPRKAAMLGVRRGLDAVLADIEQRASEHVAQCEATLADLLAQREKIVGATFPAEAGQSGRAQKVRETNSADNQLTARLRRN